MKKDKKRGLEGISPLGTFKFPFLQKAGTNFNPEGVFSVKLLLTPEDAKPFIELLDKEFKKNLEYQAVTNDIEKITAAPKPWTKEKDKKTDEETGMIQFTFKANAKRGDYDFKPKLFERTGLPYNHKRDEQGNVVPKSEVTPAIGGGTTGKVAFRTRGWYVKGEAGISLGLEAAQVFDLVPAGRNSAEEFGFSKEDIPEDTTGDENKDY